MPLLLPALVLARPLALPPALLPPANLTLLAASQKRGHPFDMEQSTRVIEAARKRCASSAENATDLQTTKKRRGKVAGCGGNVDLKFHKSAVSYSRPMLLFKHTAKAGGSCIDYVLRTAGVHHILRNEHETVSLNDLKAHYVIGLVREPCSSYVSLWAYGSQQKGQFGQRMRKARGKFKSKALFGHTPPFDTRADVLRFQSWMRDPDVRGVTAGRFLNTYGRTPNVDCWVHTENLEATLAKCLHAFEKQAGPNPISVLNWTALDAVMSEDPHKNPSDHGKCDSYFDDALAGEVRRGFDSALFDAFGWSCCGVGASDVTL